MNQMILIALLIVASFVAVLGTTTLPTTSAATSVSGTILTSGTSTSVFAFPALSILITEFLNPASPKEQRNF